MQLDKRWRATASAAAARRRVNTILSDGLSPLNPPFHTLLSSQDTGPDGPQRPALPGVVLAEGAFWPSSPTIFPESQHGVRKCTGV